MAGLSRLAAALALALATLYIGKCYANERSAREIAVWKAAEDSSVARARARRDTIRVETRVTDTLVVRARASAARVDTMWHAIPPETLAVTPRIVLELVDSLRATVAVQDSTISRFVFVERPLWQRQVAELEGLAETRKQLIRATERRIPSRWRVWSERVALGAIAFEAGKTVARR